MCNFCESGEGALLMLIYDKMEQSNRSDIETKAFFDTTDGNLIITQCLFSGPKVLSHSTVTLSPQEYNQIVNTANTVYIKQFLNMYKMEE